MSTGRITMINLDPRISTDIHVITMITLDPRSTDIIAIITKYLLSNNNNKETKMIKMKEACLLRALSHSSFIKFAHDTFKQSFNNGAPRNYSSSPVRGSI